MRETGRRSPDASGLRAPDGSATESRSALLAGPAFLLSGTASIVYEVAWERLLVLPSGIGTFSVSIVVAAFMAGLGVGSLLGAWLSTRLAPRGALRAFALVEVGLGGFAALSPLLYYHLLYLRGAWLYGSPLETAAAHFLALLVPTTLMGTSLPLLVRATVRDAGTAARTIGFLYSVNLVGAALGAFITPWLLVPHLGLDGAIWCGVGCNVLAGAMAFALAGRARTLDSAAPDNSQILAAARVEVTGEAPGRRPLAFWLGLYSLSGFCGLGLEILWFRIVDVGVKSTAFTFGTVLATYLAGLACGSLTGTLLAARLRRPLHAFLACQALVALFSGLSVILLAQLPIASPVYGWLFEYWGRDEEFILGSVGRLRPLLTLYALFPAALYLVPTLLMGFSFPALQRAVQDDPRRAGQKAGWLQAANILGCVAGSLLVGLVLLRVLGTTGTLRLIVACGLGFALLGVVIAGRRRAFGALSLALVGLLLLLPGQRALWLRLHGTTRPEALLLEDETAVVALVPRPGPRWLVYVKGAAHSWLPYGGIHTLLGALPAAVHPAPRDVAIIGLGSGETAWAAGCRRETHSITVFETAGPQAPLLRELSNQERLPGLDALLRDPRLRVTTGDGRFALQRGAARYDVIEMDALTPYLAYSGNIYSVEFFRLCAARLKPGGLLCSWAPTVRVRNAIVDTFPYVTAFEEQSILLASREPIAGDSREWAQRLGDDSAARYLGASVRDDVLAALHRASVPHRRASPGELNHDLFPADEFLRRVERRGGPHNGG